MHVANTLPLSGAQVVEASAGTGKTFTIASLYVRILLARKLTVPKILVVTYTRAATAELRDRIRARLLEAEAAFRSDQAPQDTVLAELWQSRTPAQRRGDVTQLKLALAELDRAAILTIHGFCQRALADHALQAGAPLTPELLSSERPLISEVVNDYYAQHVYGAPAIVLRDGFDLRDRLFNLALQSVHARDARLSPSPVPLPTVDCRAFDAAVDAFALAWRQHGAADVARLAASAGVLRANVYKPEQIRDDWPAEIEAYLSTRPLKIPAAILKLTQSKLEENTTQKNKGRTPRLALSDNAQALADVARRLEESVAAWKDALRSNLVIEARQRLDVAKRDHDRMAFDDLLRRLREALDAPSGVALAARLRQQYPVALVDEFQDTDPTQYAAFQRIYMGPGSDPQTEERALYLIGDPKQAIYRFRGADIFAYLDAVRAVPNAPAQLCHNYRSDPGMIDAVNHVFSRHPDPFLNRAIRFTPAQPAPTAVANLSHASALQTPLVIQWLPSEARLNVKEAEADIAVHTARHIRMTLGSSLRIHGQPVRPRDFAVLCRTNKQAALVQEALGELGIPTARDGDSSVFDGEAARELLHVLAALSQPDDAPLLRIAMATRLLGVDGAALAALDDGDEDGAWDAWVMRARAWHTLWLRRGVMAMLQRMLSEVQAHARLLASTDGERHLTDTLHLGELLQREASDHHAGPHALVQWLRTLRVDDEARQEWVGEAQQIRLESDAHAVKLTTVHRSKGLEYPIVYCPYLWHRPGGGRHGEAVIFHEQPRADALVVDVSTQKAEQILDHAAAEERAEDLRLTYVALTRARHRCVIACGNITNIASSALGHLLALEPDAKQDSRTPPSHLAALQAEANGLIAVELMAPLPAERYVNTEHGDPRAMQARIRRNVRRAAARMTSFSRLVAADAQLDRFTEDGQDHDASVEHSAAERASAQSTQAPVPMADIPGSADLGLLVHDVLEHCDHGAAAQPTLHARLKQLAPRHGVDAGSVDTLASALRETLDTPLGSGDLHFCLAEVARQDRITELEFMFPLGELSARRLADLLEAHPTEGIDPRYPAALRKLGFEAVAGYLRGYIDLCVRRDGRTFVIDYKTNDLGRHPADYATASMQTAMGASHYYLQALIYCVAVHRHLRLRQRGYDYAAHFGGFAYLFVRGMAKGYPLGTGVLHARPSERLIEELNALLGARP